jgi:hypothetical protein
MMARGFVTIKPDRLEFVQAVRPPRHIPSMYDATRCMVEVAPGSDNAERELQLNALRVNRPREAMALWRDIHPVKKFPGFWTIPMTTYHMLREHDRELAVSRQGRERFPQLELLMLGEARALAALDRPDDARESRTAYGCCPHVGHRPSGSVWLPMSCGTRPS